jgi:hypothetical protein
MKKVDVQNLLKTLNDNEICNDFYNKNLTIYFSKHPCWDEKKGVGIKYFFKAKNEWNFSFHIKRLDDTIVSIGIHFSNKNNKRLYFQKAFRNEILPQIFEFKNTINYGVDRCFFSGEILLIGNSHIDHYDLDFNDLFNSFVKKHKIDFDKHYDYLIEKKGTIYYIKNENCKAEWFKYHKENTNLRCILASVNLSRKNYDKAK